MLTILAPKVIAATLAASTPTYDLPLVPSASVLQSVKDRGCGMDEKTSSSGAILNVKLPAGIKRPRPDPVTFQAVLENFYPPDLIRARIGGDVGVSFCIGVDGRTSNHKVTRSSGYPQLDRATLEGLPYVCWEPARDAKGRPVAICKPPYEMMIAWRPPEAPPKLFGIFPVR